MNQNFLESMVNELEKRIIGEKIFSQRIFKNDCEKISENAYLIKYHTESLNSDNFPADVYEIYNLEN